MVDKTAAQVRNRVRSFSQGSGPSAASISNIVIQPPMSMPRVAAATVLQPQMSMLTQSTFSRVILQQQPVVGGGSVQTERRSNLTTPMQPLKSVIQTVNGHHPGIKVNGTATNSNGSLESTFLGKMSRPPMTTAALSSSPRSTTTTMQISQPANYLSSQAKVAAGNQIQLMGPNTGQVLASRVRIFPNQEHF